MPFTLLNQPDAPTIDQGEIDKVDFDIITAADANIGVVSGCAISQRGAGANMSVDFASGTVQVGSSVAAVTSGNVVVTAADGTNPRFDLAVVNSSGTKSVTAGTAAANPVFPAIPANSVVLAAIYVAAGVTSIVNANIVDKRMTLAPFALLAGKSGGQTLIGGTASGEDLTLQSTSNATRGTIFLEGEVEQRPTDATFTATPDWLLWDNTYTIDFASANYGSVINFAATVELSQAGGAFGAGSVIANNAIVKNVATEANNLGTHLLFNNLGFYRADGATITFANLSAYNDQPTFDVANSGVLTVTQHNSFRAFVTIGTGVTVTTRRGLHFIDATGAGTLTTQVAIDIAALAKGTTNLSLRSSGTTAQMRHAGPVVVGADAAPTAGSVALEVQSTTGALLLPRMTTTQRDALTAVNGMMIYNSTTNTVQARVNGVWTGL